MKYIWNKIKNGFKSPYENPYYDPWYDKKIDTQYNKYCYDDELKWKIIYHSDKRPYVTHDNHYYRTFKDYIDYLVTHENKTAPCDPKQFISKIPWEKKGKKDSYNNPDTNSLHPKNNYKMEANLEENNSNLSIITPVTASPSQTDKSITTHFSFHNTENSYAYIYSPFLNSENLNKNYYHIFEFLAWWNKGLKPIKTFFIQISEAGLFLSFKTLISNIALNFSNFNINLEGFFSFMVVIFFIIRVILTCYFFYKCYKNRQNIKLKIQEFYQFIQNKDNRKNIKLNIISILKTIIHKDLPKLKIKAFFYFIIFGLPIFMLLSFGVVFNFLN